MFVVNDVGTQVRDPVVERAVRGVEHCAGPEAEPSRRRLSKL